MLDEELCKIAQISSFEQYLINRLDELDDKIEEAIKKDNQLLKALLQVRKDEVQKIREKYYTQKENKKDETIQHLCSIKQGDSNDKVC